MQKKTKICVNSICFTVEKTSIDHGLQTLSLCVFVLHLELQCFHECAQWGTQVNSLVKSISKTNIESTEPGP